MSRSRAAGLALLVLAMAAIHQDTWNWKSARLVLGFLPMGLAYHAGYSILSALVMWALVRFAWPADLDRDPTPAPPRSADVTATDAGGSR